VEIRVDSRDFNKTYEKITDKVMLEAISQTIRSLKDDEVIGKQVRRRAIPKYYIKRHGIQTLYRVSLPHGWRLVYSIQSFYENERTALLLEIMDHNQYNKRFGYFKKESA
jgi:hypothetical protein